MENDAILRELKACRHELAQAERQCAAAQASRDAQCRSLEDARDEAAELKRTLEVSVGDMHLLQKKTFPRIRCRQGAAAPREICTHYSRSLQAHQQEVLSREVAAKDAALVSASQERTKASKTLSGARAEAALLAQRAEQLEGDVAVQRSLMKQLQAQVCDEVDHRAQAVKQAEEAAAQCDALRNQLQQSRAQAAALEDRLQVQATALHREEAHHTATKKQLQAAQRELEETSQRLVRAQASTAEAASLRHELQQVGRRLVQEQRQVAESAVQLDAPKNVHRWRQLGGQDLAPPESQQKLGALQRRLMSELKISAERAAKVQELQSEVARLQRALELRREGDGAAQELGRARAQLQAKDRQLQALQAQLRAEHAAGENAAAQAEKAFTELCDLKQWLSRHGMFEGGGSQPACQRNDAGSQVRLQASRRGGAAQPAGPQQPSLVLKAMKA